MNLMSNGIEAMQATGGKLSVTSRRTEDGQLLISVSDAGVGLPVDGPERILKRSSPANRTAPAWDSRSVGGSSNRMAAVCGRAPTQDGARLFSHAAADVTGSLP